MAGKLASSLSLPHDELLPQKAVLGQQLGAGAEQVTRETSNDRTRPRPQRFVDSFRGGGESQPHLVSKMSEHETHLLRGHPQLQALAVSEILCRRSVVTTTAPRRLVAPLADRVVQLIGASEIVLADETPMPVQDDRKKPYIWTFVSGTPVAYRFSMNRTGDTSKAIFGGTAGIANLCPVPEASRRMQIAACRIRQRRRCHSHALRAVERLASR